jgi:hypothetical protein
VPARASKRQIRCLTGLIVTPAAHVLDIGVANGLVLRCSIGRGQGPCSGGRCSLYSASNILRRWVALGWRGGLSNATVWCCFPGALAVSKAEMRAAILTRRKDCPGPVVIIDGTVTGNVIHLVCKSSI